MAKDKDAKKGAINFQYVNNVVPVKWLDNHGVAMVGKCLGECSKVSTVTVQLCRVKGQHVKIHTLCPVWVVLISSIKKTAACKLDPKSSGGCCYLRLFFHLMDISGVNS